MIRHHFSDKILAWYTPRKRELPWRSTNDPYKIWLSEIILQQTRINQGISYYSHFVNTFPTIFHLANASEDQILKLWQGLGYYSRARNLHFGAKQIVNEFNGTFPNNSTNLKKIKGIGDYTAAAIASIAFNEKIAAIDGNVYRVLSRIFGIETPIDSTQGIKEFKILANELITKKNPGDYNQAIMEFGALHCKPKLALCDSCPFCEICYAHINNKLAMLPVKSKKTKVINRYFNYICINTDDGCTYLNKRTKKDIWQNMYDFPLIETGKSLDIIELVKEETWKSFFGEAKITITNYSKEFIHLLSHQKIHARFIEISLKNEKNIATNFIKIDKRNIFDFAVPKIIENYLNNYKFV